MIQPVPQKPLSGCCVAIAGGQSGRRESREEADVVTPGRDHGAQDGVRRGRVHDVLWRQIPQDQMWKFLKPFNLLMRK